MPVLFVRHRFPRTHPFSGAADDALAAYRAVLARGVPVAEIGLGGDSSGRCLVLVLLGDLDRAGLPLPATAYLASPLVDLTGESAVRCDATRPDPVTPPAIVVCTNTAYAGARRSPTLGSTCWRPT